MEQTIRRWYARLGGRAGNGTFPSEGKKGVEHGVRERDETQLLCAHPKDGKSSLRFALLFLSDGPSLPLQPCLAWFVSIFVVSLSGIEFSLISDSSNDEMHSDLLSLTLARSYGNSGHGRRDGDR